MPKFIPDERLDRMKQQGWTPREVWELIDHYKELRDYVVRKQAKGKPPEERAKLRPKNYDELSEESKWKIDKALGILDWDGKSSEP